jgi:hypothetical protein
MTNVMPTATTPNREASRSTESSALLLPKNAGSMTAPTP